MTPQIQSLIARREVAKSIIISIIEINAEKQLKSTLESFWFDLDSIDNELRKLGINPFQIEKHETN